MKLITGCIVSCLGASLSLFTMATSAAEPPEPDTDAIEVIEHQPAKVYKKSDHHNYRSTRAGEHCEYQEEHDRIYCYDYEPSRVVYVEKETTYRSTRPKRYSNSHRYYRADHHRPVDPIATGLGVGLAIGLPILIHNSIDHRHYRHKYRYDRYGRYDRYKRGHYYNHKPSYRNSYRDGYRDGYRNHNRYRWRHGHRY